MYMDGYESYSHIKLSTHRRGATKLGWEEVGDSYEVGHPFPSKRPVGVVSEPTPRATQGGSSSVPLRSTMRNGHADSTP